MEKISYIYDQANKCLNCVKPMCREKGCPLKTNIPKFISEIKSNNIERAYNILQENNILSDICSRVCPVHNQCMGKCVKGIKGEPVKINYLEHFVNEWAIENNILYVPKIEKECNKKVAIIGSGPAGIACAVELRKHGANVTIFEKEPKCGGILEYGIPDFRLNKKSIDRLIKQLELLNIEIKTNIEFGKDITVDSLKNQGYDFIFLGIGAEKQSTYSLTTKETKDIYKSDDFLKMYNEGKYISNLGTVIVIGGGNVAMDAARAAVRMGANVVKILYRRNQELMPASAEELQDAINDGVQMFFQTKVVSADVFDGKVQKIECIKTKIENDKAVDIENSNYFLNANTIIFAIGAKANDKILESQNLETEYGLCKVDENYRTNIDWVYAGGDLVESKSSVAKAAATGKSAAQAILNRKECDK